MEEQSSNIAPQHILFVQMVNDFTGSCRSLNQLIKEKKKINHCHLLSSSGEGLLSDLDIPKQLYHFRTRRNRYMRLLFLIYYQWILFRKTRLLIKEWTVDEVYINTVLPFGAALAARIKGCKVSYYIHETSVRPQIFQRFLLWGIEKTASQVIYVSKYSINKLYVPNLPKLIRYNKLDDIFLERAKAWPLFSNEGVVLMLASLNKHKGLFNFVELASLCPDYQFELIISADQISINNFFKGVEIPANMKIVDRQIDVHPFYQRAALVLNLSDPNFWIESFGMTILEAGIYARPAIAPPIGGPLEIIENNRTGFLMSPKDLNEIKEKINELLSDEKYYLNIAKAAFDKARSIQSSSFRIVG